MWVFISIEMVRETDRKAGKERKREDMQEMDESDQGSCGKALVTWNEPPGCPKEKIPCVTR